LYNNPQIYMCAAPATSPSVNTDTLIIDKGETNKFQYHFTDIQYHGSLLFRNRKLLVPMWRGFVTHWSILLVRDREDRIQKKRWRERRLLFRVLSSFKLFLSVL
jgi:hypothetical protein